LGTLFTNSITGTDGTLGNNVLNTFKHYSLFIDSTSSLVI